MRNSRFLMAGLPRHWPWLLLLALVLIASALSFIVLRPPRQKRWTNEPMLLQVYYYRYPQNSHRSELVALTKLSRLTTEAEARKLLAGHGSPLFYTISANDETMPFAYNVIDISTPERPNHYRVNIVDNLVKHTIADVEYRNEPFLVIARGRDWYLAITRRLED